MTRTALALAALLLALPLAAEAQVIYDQTLDDATFRVRWMTWTHLVDANENRIPVGEEEESEQALSGTMRLRFEVDDILGTLRFTFNEYSYELQEPFLAQRTVSIPETTFSKELTAQLPDYSGILIDDGDIAIIDDPVTFRARLQVLYYRGYIDRIFGAEDQTPQRVLYDGNPNQDFPATIISDPEAVLANLEPSPDSTVTFLYPDAVEVNSETFSVEVSSRLQGEIVTMEFPPIDVPEPTATTLQTFALVAIGGWRRRRQCS